MKKSRTYTERIQNQFGGFCVRVLKNEIWYIHRERNQAAAKEKSLDNLSEKELYELAVQDDYFHADHIFHVCGKDVVVSGDMLADALKQLPPEKRDIILLSYFLEMTDAEIGKELNTVRQNISKRRARILALMREFWKRRVLNGLKREKLAFIGYLCRKRRRRTGSWCCPQPLSVMR